MRRPVINATGIVLHTNLGRSPIAEVAAKAAYNAARGYLNLDADPILISKAVQVINRGEAWVPRKMLGKIMDHVLNATYSPPELADRIF